MTSLINPSVVSPIDDNQTEPESDLIDDDKTESETQYSEPTNAPPVSRGCPKINVSHGGDVVHGAEYSRFRSYCVARSVTSRRSTHPVRSTIPTASLVARPGFTRPSKFGKVPFKVLHPLPPESRTGLTGGIQKNKGLSHTG